MLKKCAQIVVRKGIAFSFYMYAVVFLGDILLEEPGVLTHANLIFSGSSKNKEPFSD